ncbi:hypothetical protein SMACR_03296 [Sordaria macrospora]|uniref:WGS project CABT00000000 data, contig 2.10 n=2 Tax=Sordaria macrospora TaxID=5147 RepID=F7VWH2_SORMK|nr:uncharacterized protein SMAC_03296 [Sordaria macrospora k-hell]KAA8635639.1 hypothetical protein SMACR_03296 [Sordaria macrospora]KAH7630062.1 hypothetical protein B0T09DRAFT_141449 [Sordaria sp. MPI-SDFR-AT-0083]WPJ66743.1 hypothetical protein SMAC4_03296 [Sordaria macrospora]CCC09740.1 unnamed protein product [Sordaria macrospora k-hell]
MLQPRLLFFLLSSLLTWSSLPPPATALPQLPTGADLLLQEDTGQVKINPSSTSTANDDGINLPIRATIFSGVPGPSHCRGHVLLLLLVNLPQPAPPPLNPDNNNTPVTITPSTSPQCYNIPGGDSPAATATASAGCGIFQANKSAGCEARVFAEPNCIGYLNTVVFIPEERAVGGVWKSVEVRCGVPAPSDPETLGKPPLAGMMGQGGMRVKEGKKAGRRGRG